MTPEVVTAPPAPAQETAVEEAPVTVSADVDAARRGDFAAMQESVRATRGGKPLPRVSLNPDDAAPAEAVKAGQTPAEPTEQQRGVSKRQQQINDYERRIAEQTQRIADLERRMSAPVERPAAEPPPAKETPAYKRYASLPTAPKLNDVDPATGQPLYDSVEEHSAAMALFIAEQREHDANQTRSFEAQRARFEAQGQSFHERLAAASKADPDFRSKLAPELLDERDPAVPLALLAPGTPLKFKNFVAQAIWEGADPSRLLPYLSAENSKIAHELVKLPAHDLLPALHRLDGRLAAGATSPAPATAPAARAPLPSPISAAPPPAPKVTGAGSTANPADTALARGDVSFFIRQEQEKRAAGRRSA